MNTRITTTYGKSKICTSYISEKGEVVVVVPGYSETIAHTKKIIDALGELGINSFTFSPPRKYHACADEDPIIRQGGVLLEIMEASDFGNNQIVVAAHSLGCAAVLNAAQLQPKYFKQIILMQPIGLTGEVRLNELFKNTARKIKKNYLFAIKKRSIRHLGKLMIAHISSLGVIGKNPRLAISEAVSSGKYDLGEDIRRASLAGVPIDIVLSDNDELFDKEAIARKYTNKGILGKSYIRLAEDHHGHDTFWVHPRETAELINSLISN